MTLSSITPFIKTAIKMACSCQKARKLNKAICVIAGDARGVIRFEQESSKAPVKLSGIVEGLKPGKHGFHVHEFGDNSNGCISAGDHFNPTSKKHGGLHSEERHVGDLGNIEANENGIAEVDISDTQISLTGVNCIVGRTLVVHQDEDDLGVEGTPLSMTTGNSGERIGCGVIGICS